MGYAHSKKNINEILENQHSSHILKLIENLRKVLYKNNFTEITTPIIIPKKFLEKMSVTEENPLYEQVFQIDNKNFLRPMLAPNLYDVSEKLLKISKLPLRIFEIGSCFRKESEGKHHLREFTMLNLVEWGTEIENRVARIKKLGDIIMQASGISEYDFENENSVVYGDGLDITVNKTEVASSSMGPHELDGNWKISCSWVGIGFGLERLVACKNKSESITKYAKSTNFLDGNCIDIK
jgi:phenylalanyl-tRNA synthetase alpha chain